MWRFYRNKLSNCRRYSGASLFVNQFVEIVGVNNALVSDIDNFQQDWTKSYKGVVHSLDSTITCKLTYTITCRRHSSLFTA